MDKKTGMNFSRIGRRLKSVRKTLGLSIERISEMTGFSQNIILEAEKGDNEPSVIYLNGLMELFNMNINYIFSGAGEMFHDGGYGNIKRDDELNDLLYHLKDVDLVGHSVLAFYFEFKARNRDLIQKTLDEALEKEEKVLQGDDIEGDYDEI